MQDGKVVCVSVHVSSFALPDRFQLNLVLGLSESSRSNLILTHITVVYVLLCMKLPPNVVMEWLTLLIRIREVLDSDLGPGDHVD
jgi:hypothetical protein